VLGIKRPYRFGETVRMMPEQAEELAEMLKLGAVKIGGDRDGKRKRSDAKTNC